MSTEAIAKLYPGIANVKERITAEAVARTQAMLFAANQLNGYLEAATRQLATVNTHEHA